MAAGTRAVCGWRAEPGVILSRSAAWTQGYKAQPRCGRRLFLDWSEPGAARAGEERLEGDTCPARGEAGVATGLQDFGGLPRGRTSQGAGTPEAQNTQGPGWKLAAQPGLL